MNLRLTLVLLTALSLVAGYVIFIELRKPSDETTTEPYFYNVSMESIKAVDLTYVGKKQGFKYDAANLRWAFDDAPKTPVNNERWSGITLLLTGPRVTRILLDQAPEDLQPYGLDDPSVEVGIGLADGRSFLVLLGNKSPDGANYYSMRVGSPQIALVNASWGDVLIRLVEEPPYLPTPTPPVTSTPTPAPLTPTTTPAP